MMSNKSVSSKEAADNLVENIRRKTARKYSAEEKIHIVLAGLRGEESIAALCLCDAFAALGRPRACRSSAVKLAASFAG